MYAYRKPNGAEGDVYKLNSPQNEETKMEQLRVRPYLHSDCEIIKTWITDEESHMKWCANRIPFAFTTEEFEANLQEAQKEWGDMGFTATDEKGNPVGFFRLAVDHEKNTGFFKFIIVDGSMRGMGLGKKMLTKAVKYAFEIANVDEARLVVFDDNPAAVACYAKVGFEEETVLEPMEWNGNKWGRTRLVIKRKGEV